MASGRRAIWVRNEGPGKSPKLGSIENEHGAQRTRSGRRHKGGVAIIRGQGVRDDDSLGTEAGNNTRPQRNDEDEG